MTTILFLIGVSTVAVLVAVWTPTTPYHPANCCKNGKCSTCGEDIAVRFSDHGGK